jgi:excinuclease UvrABC ATPase subunit
VLTGVAGSGKSSLAAELVAQCPAVVIDQKAVGTSRRSTPVTYTGIAPAIRKLFAQRNGVPVAMFSANSAGACPECRGLGVLRTDLAFMEGQEVVCPACGGRRFSPESLTYLVNGYSIADVDELTIDQAITEFSDAGIARGLRQLAAVGLGYLRLGQSLDTLSGGECQRVKIAKELSAADDSTTYVLDEPTTGLHLDDVETLLGVLDRLVEHGHSVVVVEHNLEVIRRADWLIDLGPGPGRHGGTVLFEGRPGDYLGRETPTSRALAG